MAANNRMKPCNILFFGAAFAVLFTRQLALHEYISNLYFDFFFCFKFLEVL